MPREKREIMLALVGLLLVAGIGFVIVQAGGVRSSGQLVGWLRVSVHRKMFPEQNAERPTYDDTAKGSVALANLIGQLRVGWPSEGVTVVHEAAREVASGLLHHDDIEVGDLDHGKFVPWAMKPWEAEERVRAELMATHDFFADPARIVFQRKPAPPPPRPKRP